MWFITNKSKPVTVDVLHAVEERHPYALTPDAELKGYIAAPRRQDAIELYLHWFGFTWDERPKGVDVREFKFPRMATGKGGGAGLPKRKRPADPAVELIEEINGITRF